MTVFREKLVFLDLLDPQVPQDQCLLPCHKRVIQEIRGYQENLELVVNQESWDLQAHQELSAHQVQLDHRDSLERQAKWDHQARGVTAEYQAIQVNREL